MNGKAKIELILELKNKLKSGLSDAKKNVSSNVTGMKERLSDLKTSFVSSFKEMRSQIPLLDNALRLLKNPFVLLTAGVLAVGTMMHKTTMQAAEFNNEFLNIRQLNLDKSNEQLNAYKGLVKSVAFEVGLAGIDTSKAFYDIQSGTGLYGKAVADITTKVGKFAIATGAELPDAVNQTIKAMKAMKLGVADIDAMLVSNAKTVQVGITTFKELAQFQTEYLGAAAGAGQSLDTANKIFAAFTSISKDSRIAATMTKTAFVGLTQASTIKGLKDIGISMYDTKGNMRDLSTVLKETSAQFKGMSSEQIDAVINKIGGPEGLRNLFIKLKTGATDFFSTLEAFDSSSFSLEKALKNAQGDFKVLHMQAKNRLGLVMAEIGEKFLPLWVSGLEKVNGVLSFVWDNFDTIVSVVKNLVIGLGAMKIAMIAFNLVTWANPIGAIVGLIAGAIIGITLLVKKTEGWSKSWTAIKDIISIVWKQAKMDWEFLKDSIAHGIEVLFLRFKSFGQYIKELFTNVGQAIKLAFKGDFSGAKEALARPIVTEASREIDTLKAEYDKKKTAYMAETYSNAQAIKDAFGNISLKWKKKTDEETQSDMFGAGATSGGLTTAAAGTDPTAGEDSVGNLTGSAKQIKNITINIDSFNKGGINTQNTQLANMSAEDIEKWFSDMMIRVVNNVSTSYAG